MVNRDRIALPDCVGDFDALAHEMFIKYHRGFFRNLPYRGWLNHLAREILGVPFDDPPARETIRVHVAAFVNAGRWLVRCPVCGTGLRAQEGELAACPACGDGWWIIDFPENRCEIDCELLKQPGYRDMAPIREWKPGQDLDHLRERTAKARERQRQRPGQVVDSLSIGSLRVWAVGEVLTAANMITYLNNILDDLAGRDGAIQLENAVEIQDGPDTYLQLPSLTTTERDALTPVNGMRIYNETTTQFESYQAGSWVADTENEAHALTDAVHTGTINDTQHGVRTLANAHDHDDLSNVTSDQHHAQAHTVASHSDTTATGANLNTLVGGGSTSLHSHPTEADFQRFTSSGTYTVPSNIKTVIAEIVGAGGGGGGGQGGSAGTLRQGGSGGGGGAIVRKFFEAADLPATLTVTIGAAGGSGAGGGGVAGSNGGVGGASSVSGTGIVTVTAYGGGPGRGGNGSSNAFGGGGGGTGGAGAIDGVGGEPIPTGASSTDAKVHGGRGAGIGTANSNGGVAEHGGASGATAHTGGGVGNDGGSSIFGGGAGGSGGGLTAGDAESAGGDAGVHQSYTPGGGPSGGAVNAGPGGNGDDNPDAVGSGGAGGGSQDSGTGGNGGEGGDPGGGGGGGGAGTTSGGNGGAGGRGEVRFYAY